VLYGRMTVPMPDMARDATLSRSLELQLLLSAAIETLLRLQHGNEDDRALPVLEELAHRIERAVDELSGAPRTLSQSATAVGFVSAAQRAFGGIGTREHLQALSANIRAAARRELAAGDLKDLVDSLARLHSVLQASRTTPTDEVRGLRRLS
jgi:hypothetical protein